MYHHGSELKDIFEKIQGSRCGTKGKTEKRSYFFREIEINEQLNDIALIWKFRKLSLAIYPQKFRFQHY